VVPKASIASDDSNLKLELVVTSSADGKSFSVDTSVLLTDAPSYVKTNVTTQLQNRAIAKIKKYKSRSCICPFRTFIIR
jgi:hypothetical protein